MGLQVLVRAGAGKLVRMRASSVRLLASPSVLLACLLLAPLRAQHEPGHSRHGATFDEGPRQAAYLMLGMSEQVHFPVEGIAAEAQRFFDQGVTQLHGFWYFEAERSFRQVLVLAPGHAMAYWGIALANIEAPARAAGSIARAVAASGALPDRERRYVDAWAAFYQLDDQARAELTSGDDARVQAAITALAAKNEKREQKLDDERYRQLLKDLGTIVYEYPDDLEAKALLAIHVWLAYDWGAGIPIVSHTAVDALLDQVFAKAPKHPAHHYRIHLWDREDGRRALASARQIGDSAPGIAHQWHMAGHIYAKLDRHAEAAWQQEASGRVDHAHMRRDRVMPFLIHNYGHNQEWLARSLSYLGDVDAALGIAKNLAELPRHPKFNRLDESDSIAGYARARLVQVCEDFALWRTAVELDRSGHLEASDDIGGEVDRLGLLGRAWFRLGDVDAGDRIVAAVGDLLVRARQRRAQLIDEAESAAFAAAPEPKKVREAASEAAKKPTDQVQSVLQLQRELAAERLLATGDAAAALVIFEAQRGLSKLLLADAHLAAGAADKAVEVLEAEVKAQPRRAASMLRLVIALEAAGTEASKARAEELRGQLRGEPFELADVELTKLARIHSPGLGLRLAVPGDAEPLFPDVRTFGDDFGPRPELATLGPVHWQPWSAPSCTLPKVGGGTLAIGAGASTRPTLVVFYLGFGCLHCVEQLHALRPKVAAFGALGIDVVAVGSDTLAAATEAAAALAPDQALPFPLLADPELAAFRAFRCHDDFEGMPLHGTFLLDAEGRVRWQDISYEPFVQIEWLVGEAARLLRLPAQAGGK
jgi:peroxiredoxin